MISFTGSTPVGSLLMAQAAGTIKHVALELGGNAPFIVFDDANLDAAVDGAIAAKFRNMGQTCICTNRLYVQDKVHDIFVTRLAERVRQLTVGNGVVQGVEQGPLINEAALLKVQRHIADATARGGTVVVGGQPHALGGTFFEPTVLTGVTSDMLVAQEETFGPVAAVFRFNDEAEVIQSANNTQAGLAAYAYTQDNARVFRLINLLEYGIVGINTGLVSTEIAPFGGTKQSGNSREGSRHGLNEYTYLRYACINSR
jgi:succinate-semialdehyde dehydrogenase/glutarate-semialdehyde dehydrogenase